MVKKGVSLEEKKQRLLKIFHTDLCPYTLKEIEKLGSKAGISMMSIKGVLQEMVDDSIVDLDKVGITNFYWSFPTKLNVQKQKEFQKLKQTSIQFQEEIQKKQLSLQKLIRERKGSSSTDIEQYQSLKRKNGEISQNISKLKKAREGFVLKQQVKISKAGAVLWTDNTWVLSDWMKKKFGLPSKDINQQLRIKEDFDYPVYKKKK
eukprot:snap_masked-scaffold_71-processed-gene-0.14-mRNA-1 protein AED:0.37 eAED:0.37 QI:0/-1/0/1/-1/1/1/0/204